MLERHPRHLLFSPYNIVAHTHARGLHDLFDCSYPPRNASTAIGWALVPPVQGRSHLGPRRGLLCAPIPIAATAALRGGERRW